FIARPGSVDRSTRVVAVHGLPPEIADQEHEVGEGLVGAFLAAAPIMIEDWSSDPRVAALVGPARSGGRPSPRSSMSVPVRVLGKDWGRLAVADVVPRRFSDVDLDRLLAVADVLAAALERERIEAGRAALARLGRLALESRDLDEVL